jgi:hypothetical protein
VEEAMKKMSLRCAFVAAVVLAFGMVVSGVADAKPDKAPKSNKGNGTINKVAICHVKGKKNGTDIVRYQLISVAQSAVAAHLAHGDAVAGSVLNGGKTYIGDDCSFSDVTTVDAATTEVPVLLIRDTCAVVTCASGENAVGGGYEPTTTQLTSRVATSVDISACTNYGTGGTTGWVVVNDSGADVNLTDFYVLCISAE